MMHGVFFCSEVDVNGTEQLSSTPGICAAWNHCSMQQPHSTTGPTRPYPTAAVGYCSTPCLTTAALSAGVLLPSSSVNRYFMLLFLISSFVFLLVPSFWTCIALRLLDDQQVSSSGTTDYFMLFCFFLGRFINQTEVSRSILGCSCEH
jgi:hypothetical protein